MATRKKSSSSGMSPAHKAALAEGRAQGRAVRQYLEALEAQRPKRGRKRTTDSISARLATVDAELETAVAVKRLHLVQEKIDLEKELEASDETVDLTDLEAAFVAAAAEYSERKGISYSAWRQMGVPAATLRDAGINRGS